MPLRVFETDQSSLQDVADEYLIFYSSLTDGELWCPDCRNIDSTVQEIFGPPDSPKALIIYVGQIAEWKRPTNPFRGEPWRIESIPTIIKRQGSREIGRLVDSEVEGMKNNIASFVNNDLSLPVDV